MTVPVNIVQQVKLVTPVMLAYLQNLNCAVATWNTKYQNFDKQSGSLGSSVAISLPTRATASNTLVANFDGIEQLIQNLTVDSAANSANAITNQEYIFNLSKEDFLKEIGMQRVREFSAKVEANLLLDFVSGRPVGDINGNPTGALHTESGPWRFFGNGSNVITSYQSLQQAIVNFRNFGSPDLLKVYLPDTIVPTIVGSGLNQFAPERNNEIANSWEIGRFGTPPVEFYSSNLLPLHTAGSCGEEGLTLTVVSTNDPTGQNITQITFSGAPTTDANAIKAGDLGMFLDGVSGQPNVRLVTYTGHVPCAQPVQFRATANAGSTGGQVTVTLSQPLNSVAGDKNQLITSNIVAGMQVKFLPSHKAGGIVAGDAAYLAMPRLPDEVPFPTGLATDKETGVSLRTYYGTLFGQNQRGFVTDGVWAATMVPLYSMRLIFPVTF